MRDNPKVVKLERSAAYLHHRAMMNRRDNNIVDALELMRRAVEASPENREYRLDLAELYCEMGCHEQSSRLLLDMLAQRDAPAECYYGLALNQLGMNDLSGARHSLNQYRRQEPDGAHLEDVRQLSDELDLYTSMNRPASRKLYRAMRVANRACDAMKADDPRKACRLFESTLKLAGEQYEMRALYAMALLMAGDTDAAREQAELAVAGYPPSVRALCVSAQVYAMLDEEAAAHALMERAWAEHPSGAELRLMIYAAAETNMHERAAECARLALQETPYDRELLHIRAVTLLKSGQPASEAAHCWERILRIDPEDTIAQYYSEAAALDALSPRRLEYAYQVPDEEYNRRVLELTAKLAEGYERIAALWESDVRFRSLLRWAMTTDDIKLGRAAITLLSTLEDDDAKSVLRELLFDPSVARELKLHAAVLMKLQGRELREVMPGPMSAMGEVLMDTDSLLNDMPVGDRQLVRFADEVLEREYDISALPALAVMWSSYRRLRGTKGDPLKRVEASAAALAYNFLQGNGVRTNMHRLANAFGCNFRQMVFCARRIADCLDRYGGDDAEE